MPLTVELRRLLPGSKTKNMLEKRCVGGILPRVRHHGETRRTWKGSGFRKEKEM